MNSKARGIAACLSSLIIVVLLLASIATPSRAQAPAQSLKDTLVGTWQLVSITINDAAPFGTEPHGSMFLDAGGHYSIIVLSGGGARNIAYYGSYTVSDPDSSINFHIDGSTRANGDGRDHKRVVTLSGDNLTIATVPTAGRRGIKLTWKRMK